MEARQSSHMDGMGMGWLEILGRLGILAVDLS